MGPDVRSSRLSLVTHGRGRGGSFICSLFSGQGAGGLESLSYEWTCSAMSEGRPMPFPPLKPTPKLTRARCSYAGRKSCPRMKWPSPLDLAHGTEWGTSGQQGGCGVHHRAGSTVFSSTCFYLFIYFQHFLKTFRFSDLTLGLGLTSSSRHSQNSPLRETVPLPDKHSRVW